VLLGVTDRYRVANINKGILDPREREETHAGGSGLASEKDGMPSNSFC
jgi:hypothetical protein